jgi:transposase
VIVSHPSYRPNGDNQIKLIIHPNRCLKNVVKEPFIIKVKHYNIMEVKMETRFIGVDLHKKSFTTAVKIKEGEFKMYCFNFDFQGIEDFKKTLMHEDYVAIESSTQAFFLYNQIISLVKKCVIVNPRKFKVISDSTSKTDKKDAKLLADYLKYEDLLPTVYVPDKDIIKLRSYFSIYKLTNKQIAQTKNRIQSILLQNGIVLESSFLFNNKYREAVLNVDIDKGYVEIIKCLYEKLDYLIKEKETITYKIFIHGKRYKKETEIITSLSGISMLIAFCLISDIGDIKRFGNAKKLCSYLGVVPKVDSSGESCYAGKIHKEARKDSRSLLTQVINHLCNNSEYLKDFYDRKKKAKSCGKARIAVIRKIIVIIYHMLVNNEYYYYRDPKKHERKILEYDKFIKTYEEKNYIYLNKKIA